MTDLISVIKPNGEKFDIKCSFNDKKIDYNKVDDRIEKGDSLVRKISEKIIEEYEIIDLKYHGIGDPMFEGTDIYFQKKGIERQEKGPHNITINNHGGNVALHNSGSMIIGDRNIDKIIELIENQNLYNKEELKQLLVQYKETKDESLIHKTLQNLASVVDIGKIILGIGTMLS